MPRMSAFLVGVFCSASIICPYLKSEELIFADFSDLSNFTLNGDTAIINHDGPQFYGDQFVLRLTDDLWQAGSAYYSLPISFTDNTSFSTLFQFQITDPCGYIDSSDNIQGADGMTFILTARPDALGDLGGGLGYFGISNSICVEIDTWRNSRNPTIDPNNGNHIGINLSDDPASVVTQNISTPLNNGGVWSMWIEYHGETDLLEVRISETPQRPSEPSLRLNINIPSIVGQEIYVGFTSGTGAACNDHDIRYWEFSSWISQENRPPEITHTPIETAQLGEEIVFSFEVTDPDDNLTSVKLFYRISGDPEFIEQEVFTPGRTHYDVFVSGLTETLAGVEYYIQAEDAEGLTAIHASKDGAHFICIVDPERRIPVIFIPGITGTELYDAETGELIWINPERAVSKNDSWLLRLLLQEDGITPDTRDRCRSDFSLTCISSSDCPLEEECITGGRQMRIGNIVNIPGFFTAYRDLVQYLVDQGYTLQQDLFLFGYDWRLDNAIIVDRLKSIIDEIAGDRCGKVNIIAHSMGGLIVRRYFSKYPDNKIDTVIYLGTPHQGSLKAYAIIAGFASLVKEPFLGLHKYINLETTTFVVNNFPSIYQLLPRFPFLVIEGQGSEPSDESIERIINANPQLVQRAKIFYESIENFQPIARSFAINGSGFATAQAFFIDSDGSIHALVDLQGDETVPKRSSTALPQTRYFFAREEHSRLPGNRFVQQKILHILNKEEDKPVSGIRDDPFTAEKGWQWHTRSPVLIEIADSSGGINGLDEEGNLREGIPGSYHFIFEHNESGFLPYNNEYHIAIQAVQTGRFSLEFEAIDSNYQIFREIRFREIPISKDGRAECELSPESESVLLLDVDGDGEEDFAIPPDTPAPPELEEQFVENGDVNRDRRLDMSDAIAIFRYLFLGDEIACLEAGDANSDSNFDLSDGISLLNYLFRGTADKPQGLAYCP